MQPGEASPYPGQQFRRMAEVGDEGVFDRENCRCWNQLSWLTRPARILFGDPDIVGEDAAELAPRSHE